VELQDVVRHTDQRPFTLYFVITAQQELSKSLPVLDLSEHRLHDRLSSGIDFPPDDGLQLAPHTFQGRGRLGDRTARTGRDHLVVFLFARRHVSVDLHLGGPLQVLLGGGPIPLVLSVASADRVEQFL